MKTKTLLMIGVAGAALAYFFLLRKKNTSVPEPVDVPVDTQDAIEPVTTPLKPVKEAETGYGVRKHRAVTLNNLFQGQTGGVKPPMAPNRLSAYSQTFVNRVYTIVKQRHGDKANTGLYPDSKRLALYERVWGQLLNQGLENPMQATLGQINVAVGAVGMEGFAFPH